MMSLGVVFFLFFPPGEEPVLLHQRIHAPLSEALGGSAWPCIEPQREKEERERRETPHSHSPLTL